MMQTKANFVTRIFSRNLPTTEWLNVLTHGIGIILTLIAIPFIITVSTDVLTTGQLIGVLAFCFGLLFMYSSSTAYHYAMRERSKKLLKILDHIAIFILIGGSYTAFVLTYLNNSTGWIFLGIMWSIITVGIILKLFFTGRFEWVSLMLYLVLGWMVIFIYSDMTAVMPEAVKYWLITGGLSYTFGTIFYAVKQIPHGHAIWHLFVMGGTVTHYVSLYSGITDYQLGL